MSAENIMCRECEKGFIAYETEEHFEYKNKITKLFRLDKELCPHCGGDFLFENIGEINES